MAFMPQHDNKPIPHVYVLDDGRKKRTFDELEAALAWRAEAMAAGRKVTIGTSLTVPVNVNTKAA